MWKLNNASPILVATFALLLALGVGMARSVALEAKPGAASGDATAGSGYQLRCWQYGKLLFEESHVEFADAKSGLELRRTQGERGKLYVIDTANATCLMKADAAPATPPAKPGAQ